MNSSYYGLWLHDGATFDNQTGASFTYLTSAGIYSDGSGATFQNDGLLTQTAAVTNASGIYAIFNQSATGSTEVKGGGVFFEGGGTITGTMTADLGAYLQFDGGTFNLDSSSTISGAGTVYFTRATVNDAGSYGAAAGTVVSGGTANLTGTITELGAGLNISGGTLNLATGQSFTIPTLTMSGGTLTGFPTLTVTGLTDWTGGTITGGGTLTAGGSLTLGDPNQSDLELLDGATLVNPGAATIATVNSSYYGLWLHDGATFDNQTGASFTYLTSAGIYSDGSGATFQNDGLLTQTAAVTNGSGIYAIFNQSATGSTEVQGGGVFFEGGGTITGTMTADVGAYLQFDGGTFNLDSSSTISGAGTVYFTRATVNDAGSYGAAAGTVVSGGTANLTGTITELGAGLNISGGTLNLATGQSFTIPTLTMSGGTLTGFPTLTVTGLTDWTGGTITGGGTLTAGGSLTLGDPNQSDLELLDGATLVNPGAATIATVNSSYYGLWLHDGATFDNQTGASFTYLTSAGIYSDGSGATFQNDGLLTQTAAVTNGSGIYAIFNQSATGSTEVQGGGVFFEGGGTITGTMTADVGAYLQFDGGTFNLDSSSTISGAGTVYFTRATVNDAGSYGAAAGTVVSGGTANLTGTITELGAGLNISGGTLNLATGQSFTIPTLTMSGGTLTGFPTLTVTGLTDWTGGTITGGGTLTAGGSLTLGDPNQSDLELLDGATLVNPGAATIATVNSSYYGLWLHDGATFDNQTGASFTYLTSAGIYSDGSGATFQNDGLLTQTAAVTNASGIYSIFNQSATGSTEVQGGGVFFEGGGTITGTMTADVGAYLEFDGGTFNLDSSSTISGAGTVYFNRATFNDAGNYSAAGTVVSGGSLNLAADRSFTFAALSMSGGTLTGFSSLTVTGSTDWTGGTITGGGTLTAQGPLTLGDPNQSDVEVLDGATLVNLGAATIATLNSSYYGLWLYDGATFDNQTGASFTFLTNARIYSDGTGTTFQNDGAVVQSAAATDSSLVYAVFDQGSTGTTLVQGGTFEIVGNSTFAGTVEATGGGAVVMTTVPTNLAGGTLTGATWTVDVNSSISLGASITTNAATIVLDGAGADFSSLSPLSQIAPGGNLTILDGGSFTTAGDLDNAGTIDLAPGTLNVTGNYTQESSGTYAVGVGGLAVGGGLGQLAVSGVATLDGTLSVSLINGYTPPPGDSYPVITFASEAGDFSEELGLYLGGARDSLPSSTRAATPPSWISWPCPS